MSICCADNISLLVNKCAFSYVMTHLRVQNKNGCVFDLALSD